MRKYKKLRWERLGNGFDLICLNPDQLDQKVARMLLRKIKVIYDDFKKAFDEDASKLWQEWIENPSQPLEETAYSMLSNWFLTESPASISIRAALALLLWHKLFCAIPDHRLTNWRVSGRKVFYKDVFERWWKKQQQCQKDC